MVKIMIAAAVAAAAVFVAPADAQTKYFARASMPGIKTGTSGTPTPPKVVGNCGALVKGDWFVDNQYATGLVATTLAQAQSACAEWAKKGVGTCGWTNDAYYDSDFLYKVYWTETVETRKYNTTPWNGVGYVWAVKCPAA
jgi:hypothetical protein